MTESAEVLAVRLKGSNADLIADCIRLGYISGLVLDPTYGRGRFWTGALSAAEECGASIVLSAHDIDPERSPYEPMDFRAMTYEDGTFDSVVFDPPYKLNGTGGSHPSDDDYGVATPYISLDDMRDMMREGFSECARVAKPGGYVLVKCQDQVSSGKVRWQTLDYISWAGEHRLELVDMLHLVSYRPQPVGRAQRHARRNYSTMLVFNKSKKGSR